MKKIYLFGLCGCAAIINSVLADSVPALDGTMSWGIQYPSVSTPAQTATVTKGNTVAQGTEKKAKAAATGVNQTLNPKAIRQAVTEYTTLSSTKTGWKPTDFTDQLLNVCLSEHVAKDGTYNTNITVKQFFNCCVSTLHGSPTDCKEFIQKVVDVHNALARSYILGAGKPGEPCSADDLAKVNFATAGKYAMVNGVQRCAATACKQGFYIDRYTDEAKYGNSKGYCRAGEDPWLCDTITGKCVLKASVVQQQEEVVQEGTKFLPDALMEMDFFKQYCVGSGKLNCVRKPDGSIQTSVECTTKPGVDNTALMTDAAAVCNGTFVPAQTVVTDPSVTTEPVITEPVTTEPVTTEPVTTEPVITEPVTTETPVQTEAQLVPTAEQEIVEKHNPSDLQIINPVSASDVKINVVIPEQEKSMKDLQKEEKALQAEVAKLELQAKVGTDCSHADLRKVDAKATAGSYQMDGKNLKCVITACEEGFAPLNGKKCAKDSKVGKMCVNGDVHTLKSSFQEVNGSIVCIVEKCHNNYKPFPEVNPTKCVEDKVGRKCNAPNAKKAQYAADGVTCVATECEDRLLYELKDGQCVLDTAVQAEYAKYKVKTADAYEREKAKQDKKDAKLAAQQAELEAQKARNDELRRQIQAAQAQQQ